MHEAPPFPLLGAIIILIAIGTVIAKLAALVWVICTLFL